MPLNAGEGFLIVNADDFGVTEGVNRGIIEAHEQGVVTSASLMVRYPAALAAAEYARDHPKFSVGLHFETGEWRFRDGSWAVAYQVVDTHDREAVLAEFERQITAFEGLVGRPPTHLDSHQHIHEREPARSVLSEYAEKHKIPLRNCSPRLTYNGRLYGQTVSGEPFPQGISVARLIEIIELLRPGWTELGCHPGYANQLDSVYLHEREIEVRTLIDLKIREALDRGGVTLCSFKDFNAA